MFIMMIMTTMLLIIIIMLIIIIKEQTSNDCRETIIKVITPLGVQGWRSGESTRLPSMWPGFDSRIRRHMWVEFVDSLLSTERFSPGAPVSPLLKNHHFTHSVLGAPMNSTGYLRLLSSLAKTPEKCWKAH